MAYAYGRSKFSAQGLVLTYEYFKEKGFEDEDIIIIIKHIPARYVTDEDRNILTFYKEIGVIHEAPSRIAGQELIRSDDDLFILTTAKRFQANILTNDRYREFATNPEFSGVIKERIVQANFIKDELILPQDPLGPNGPNLNTFLRFPN